MEKKGRSTEIHAKMRYICGYCSASRNDLSLFESSGSCTNCGGMNPEYHFFLEGKDFPGSVLVYFAKDAAKQGKELVEVLEAQGWNVITHDEIDFRSIDRTEERNLIRDRMGGVFIIPSAGLVAEETDTIQFLFDANSMVPFGKLDKTIFLLSKDDQANILIDYHYKYNRGITAMSLTGDGDLEKYQGVAIASSKMMTRFLEAYKSQRLGK